MQNTVEPLYPPNTSGIQTVLCPEASRNKYVTWLLLETSSNLVNPLIVSHSLAGNLSTEFFVDLFFYYSEFKNMHLIDVIPEVLPPAEIL